MPIEFDGLPSQGGFYLAVYNNPPVIGLRVERNITTLDQLQRAARDLRALAAWLEQQHINFSGTENDGQAG